MTGASLALCCPPRPGSGGRPVRVDPSARGVALRGTAGGVRGAGAPRPACLTRLEGGPRAARPGGPDPGRGARSARIEGALLTEPSQVTLDFQDAPLAEAVRSFSEQTGVKLTVRPRIPPNCSPARSPSTSRAADLLEGDRPALRCGPPSIQLRDARVPERPGAGLPSLRRGRQARRAGLGLGAVPGQRRRGPLPERRELPAPRAERPPRPGRRPPRSRQRAILRPVAGRGRAPAFLDPERPVEGDRSGGRPGNLAGRPDGGGPDLRRSGYFGFATGSVIQLQAA